MVPEFADGAARAWISHRYVLWDALRLANVVRDMQPFALAGAPSRGVGKRYRRERYGSGDCCKRLDEHGHHSVYSRLNWQPNRSWPFTDETGPSRPNSPFGTGRKPVGPHDELSPFMGQRWA